MAGKVWAGKYKECDKCHTYGCCEGYSFQNKNIKNPESFILPEEATKIINLIGDDSFYTPPKKGKTFGRMRRYPSGRCIFLADDGCMIQKFRPYDCRMFPFDIIHKDNKFFLIRYVDICPEEADFSQHNLDDVIKMAMPEAKAYAIEAVLSTITDQHQVLCEIDIESGKRIEL